MTTFKHLILATLIASVPAGAAAQARVPAVDSGAIGGDVGIFLPAEDQMAKSLTLEGFYEYYFDPRASLRVGAGWWNPEFDRDPNASMRTFRVAVDGVYNWEGGAVHPFLGAGIAAYFLSLRDRGDAVGDDETKLGGTVFGGIELFASRTTAVKLEARYHLVSNAGPYNPDGLALTVGLKKYF